MAGRLTGRWGWQATLLPEQQASWLAAGGAALHSHLVCAWDGLAVEALEQHVCRLVGAELKEGIACASNSSSSSSAAAEGCGGQQQAMANGSTNFQPTPSCCGRFAAQSHPCHRCTLPFGSMRAPERLQCSRVDNSRQAAAAAAAGGAPSLAPVARLRMSLTLTSWLVPTKMLYRKLSSIHGCRSPTCRHAAAGRRGEVRCGVGAATGAGAAERAGTVHPVAALIAAASAVPRRSSAQMPHSGSAAAAAARGLPPCVFVPPTGLAVHLPRGSCWPPPPREWRW